MTQKIDSVAKALRDRVRTALAALGDGHGSLSDWDDLVNCIVVLLTEAKQEDKPMTIDEATPGYGMPGCAGHEEQERWRTAVSFVKTFFPTSQHTQLRYQAIDDLLRRDRETQASAAERRRQQDVQQARRKALEEAAALSESMTGRVRSPITREVAAAIRTLEEPKP